MRTAHSTFVRLLPRLLVLTAAMLSAGAAEIGAQSLGGEPLPIDVALSLSGHNGRSPIEISPDGEWLAHTIETHDTVPRGDSYAYADSGVPFAEGTSRKEATLSNLRTGEQVRLGDADASSWGASWSPDGWKVAFYSDQGGDAGLWIWDRTERTARRATDATVRPFFGFETPRWSPDGAHVLVRLLPEGMTIAEANALVPATTAEPATTADLDPDQPAVTVRRSSAARADEEAPAEPEEASPVPDGAMARRIRGLSADLALVDVASGDTTRLVSLVRSPMAAFSPDGRRIAYTASVGAVPNSQQSIFDVRAYDLETGGETLLAGAVMLRYGIEWSWSPDGSRLAYTRSGGMAEGDVVVVEVPSGASRRLENDAPHLAPGEGEVPPLWSADGSVIYGVGDGAVWAIDPNSGSAREAVRIDGWTIRRLVTASYFTPVVWSIDGGETLWTVSSRPDGSVYAIHSLRPDEGEATRRLEESRAWSGIFSLAASEAGHEIVYVASDQQQPGELHAFDTRAGDVRRVSRINAELGGYALGEARLIEWRSAHGEPLRGALLLPPGWDDDPRPLPLVVWVYGGENGSAWFNRFGFWGSLPTFNMHVLATRGYAVLAPDIPLRTGRTTEDLAASVLPGVNAAIEQGYADPERLALMGQSYGSLNTLAILTQTDRFAAAVVTAAGQHPDLVADYLMNESAAYYEQGQGDMGGTIWEYPDRYRVNSPIFDFPRIDTPVLIGQGEQDGELTGPDAIFNALDRLGKVAEYRVYRGEGHVISRRANVLDFWNRRLEFLAEHLDLVVRDDGVVSIPEQ